MNALWVACVAKEFWADYDRTIPPVTNARQKRMKTSCNLCPLSVEQKVSNGEPRRLGNDHIATLFLEMLIMLFG